MQQKPLMYITKKIHREVNEKTSNMSFKILGMSIYIFPKMTCSFSRPKTTFKSILL